jgi:hypothetical protein
VAGDRRALIQHAVAVVAAYSVFFCWLFAQQLVEKVYLAEADLYDWFLPLFLSPFARWTHEMYAGLPTFADTSDATPYVLQFLFARVFHSWAGYVISAYVVGASLMYAYVFSVTRSRAAAAFAGLAYGLSDSMLLRHGHINIVHASAWFPLMVLAIDRLAVTNSWRWAGIGAFASANCFLAGHPQPLVYAASFCFLYAVTGGIAQRANTGFYVRAITMMALGAAITAIKSVPFLEAARLMARTEMSYSRFVDGSPTATELLGVLFPSARSIGGEAPLYCGITAILLAIVGIIASRRNWRVWCWVAGGMFALLIAAGDATPVARVAYYLPLYGKFRISSRALFVFAASVAALGGFGVAAPATRGLSRRVVGAAALALATALAIGGVLLTITGAPAMTIARQVGFAVLAAAAAYWAAGRHSFPLAIAPVLIVLAADLLLRVPYTISGSGLKLSVEDAASLRPSVHAEQLAREIAPTYQRVLAISGSSRDPIIPSAYSRLWQIPIAGGYSPIMLGRLTELAKMGAPGDVFPEVLAFDDRALDLLSVRYIIVREDEYGPPPTLERSGLPWARAPLQLSIGRPACDQMYERSRSFALPAGIDVAALAVVGHLRCAENVKQGTIVGNITIIGPGGFTFEQPLRAGVELAERGLSAAKVRERAQHQAAARFDDPELEPYSYQMRIDLPHPTRGAEVTIAGAPSPGWIAIDRLTVIDDKGHAFAQGTGPLFLADTRRWREVRRVRTSRRSDRGVDIERAGEQHLTVYENRRAMPRAWIAPSAVRLSDEETLASIRYSQLPGGRRFDPAQTVILDSDGEVHTFAPGPSWVDITTIHDGRIAMHVSSANGGYLVLSETYYPGWRARVDDRDVPVQRVNLMFQGVVVPAGAHDVIFELASNTLRAGIAITLCALVLGAVLVWRG